MPGIMIIDDQDVVRDGIRKILQEIDMGFGEIYSSSDGEEAMEMIIDKNPDIILVDIMMPRLNGLELIRSIRYRNIKTSIVIISAYNDFNFARQAIDYKVDSYILKPVTKEELYPVLIAIKKDIGYGQRNTAEFKEETGKYYSMLLLRYLSGEDIMINIDGVFRNLEVDFQDDNFMIGAFYCTKKDNGKNLSIVKKVIDGRFAGRKIGFYSFYYESDKLFYILNIKKENYPVIEAIIRDYAERCSSGIKAGISAQIEGAQSLRELFRQAEAALKECLFQGYRVCGFYDMKKTAGNIVSMKDYAMILEYLVCEKKKELVDFLSSLIFKITGNSMSYGEINNSFFNIINYLSIQLIGVYPEICNTDEVRESLKCARSISEMKFYLMEVIESMYEHVHHLNNLDKSFYVVNYIMNYVKKNYAKNISLIEISNELSMNYSYVSFLFKKKTNMTFSEYLMKIRLDNAKKLLDTGNYKIYEIAALCGYYDSKYFCKEFKKHFNRSPSQCKVRSPERIS